MKKSIIRMASILALAFLAAPLMVRAQQGVRVDVPFAFTADKVTLPAGEYVVKGSAVDRGTLLIQRVDTAASIFVPSYSAEKSAPQSECKLIFHRYGQRYFLWQVWSAGSAIGRELPKSAKEKEEALTARHEAPEEVTIVARLSPR
jgi:hypothetical protein